MSKTPLTTIDPDNPVEFIEQVRTLLAAKDDIANEEK